MNLEQDNLNQKKEQGTNPQNVQPTPVLAETQSPSSRNPKKIGIVIVTAVLVVIIVVCLIFLLTKKGDKDKKEDAKDSNQNSGIQESVNITGDIEQIKEYARNDDSGYTLFASEELDPYLIYRVDDDEYQVLDVNGKVVYTKNHEPGVYLGDGYFLDYENTSNAEKHTVLNVDGLEESFDHAREVLSYYQNGIWYHSYYMYDGQFTKYTQAYDLKNKKMLWENKDGIDPYILENGKMVLKTSKDGAGKIIVDKDTGKVLIKANDENETLYATEGAYYRVTDTELSVYDYDNNKLSSYTFQKTDGNTKLETLLSTGGYVIRDVYEEYPPSYTVYNKNGKVLLSFRGTGATARSLYTYAPGVDVANKYSTTKYSVLTVDGSTHYKASYIIYDDDSYVVLYNMQNIGEYAIGCVDSNCESYKMINLETRQEKVISELRSSYFERADNSEYWSASGNENYSIYDGNFEIVYSSTKKLSPVSGEYFLEIDNQQDKSVLSLINVKTSQKTTLKTEGHYLFHTANNLVTQLDSKQILYKFK